MLARSCAYRTLCALQSLLQYALSLALIGQLRIAAVPSPHHHRRRDRCSPLDELPSSSRHTSARLLASSLDRASPLLVLVPSSQQLRSSTSKHASRRSLRRGAPDASGGGSAAALPDVGSADRSVAAQPQRSRFMRSARRTVRWRRRLSRSASRRRGASRRRLGGSFDGGATAAVALPGIGSANRLVAAAAQNRRTPHDAAALPDDVGSADRSVARASLNSRCSSRTRRTW